MHLRTVWVATVGYFGGVGIYGGLGAVRNLVWVCCHLYRFLFLVGPLLPYVFSAGLVCGGGMHGVRALSLWGTNIK